MKKIVKGNDFTLRIPVKKMVEGQAQPFPLPTCTDVVVQVCNQFKRIPLAFEIDVKEDNVLLARVEGDKMSLGTYAIEVKGKIFGNDWRSNEYPQFAIVSNNADADTEFGTTDEGDNSVEMDTAMVILPPSVELSDLISDTNEALGKVDGAVSKTDEAVKKANDAVSQVNGALKKVQNVDIDVDGTNLNITRPSGEKKEFDLMQLKGDSFTYNDFTEAEIKELQKPATEAATKAQEVLKKAETATTGAEKVNAELEGNVFEVTDRTGVKKALDLSGMVSAQSDVARIQESMGAYSDRPDITLVAKETNKAISSDGVKVTKAGWAIAEFTAELGNIYLFNTGETSSDVCVFAEYIDKVETRAIDYAYTYDESGRVLTAKATYNGKTYTYTYDYSTDEAVITDQDNNKVSSLPSVYTTTVGAYNPMTILNANAELPQDGYCRFVSNFTTASAIKIVVSYKVNSANLTMKVVRDGSTANMCSQLAKINKKVDDIAEKQTSHSKLLIHTCKEGCIIRIDNKDISLEARKNYSFDKFKTFSFIQKKQAINRLHISNSTYFRTEQFSNFESLTSLSFDNYKPKHVNMQGVFSFCYLLTNLDVHDWVTSNVNSIQNMFYSCTSLTNLDVSGWDTSNVTNMSGIFYNCTNLQKLTFGENFGRMTDKVGKLDLSFLESWKNDSVKSLLTLYDRKTNGMGVITLKLHANAKAVLGEDGIAQLTAKGYIIA